MTSIDIFYQGEGIGEIAHIEARARTHTFAAAQGSRSSRSTALGTDDPDLPRRRATSRSTRACLLRDRARPSGLKVHVHRCRHVEVTVTFNGETVHHRFAPGRDRRAGQDAGPPSTSSA